MLFIAGLKYMDQYRQYQSYVTTSGTCNYKIDACKIILGELI